MDLPGMSLTDKDVHISRSIKRRKRSWVWKYFEKLGTQRFRCNLCSTELSITAPTTNLNRHVKCKHPDVYNLETEGSMVARKNIAKAVLKKKRQRSWIWKYFVKLCVSRYRCDVCGVVLNIKYPYNNNNLKRHFRRKHPNLYKALLKKFSHWRVTKANSDDGNKLEPDTLNNLGELTFIKEVDGGIIADKETIDNEMDPETITVSETIYVDERDVSYYEEVESEENTCVEFADKNPAESSDLKRKGRSWIWQYFDQVSEQQYKCSICAVILSIKVNQSNANMHRHYRLKHPDIYKSMLKKIYDNNEDNEFINESVESSEDLVGEEQTSDWNWVFHLFDYSKDAHTCSICKFKCRKLGDAEKNLANLREHLSIKHGLVSSDQVTISQDDDEDC